MIKVIRILEVPILLLIIAYGDLNTDYTGLAIFLIALSIIRLIANVITDEFIYKKR